MHQVKLPTLSDAQVADAGNLLIEARLGTRLLGELPKSCRPENLADSQRILDYLHRKRGELAVGWKVFIPYKPMHPPVIAPIYDVRQSGGTIAQSDPKRRIEAEVVFRARRDLPPRETPYSFAEATEAMVAMPAFEVLQTRYRAEPIATRWSTAKPAREYVYEAMADDNTHGCYVVGDEVPCWAEIDFTTLTVIVLQDGAQIGASTGGHPMQNPFLCTFAGLNFLRHRDGVSRGQIIATSSLTSYFEVPTEAVITADFGPLGSVSARYVEA